MTYPANTFSPDSSGQMFLEIRDNGKVLFRVKAASLRWLESQVYAGIKSIPGKGLEIGGLTIGAISHEEDLAGSTIEYFASVGIKYLLGPSFRPGEADRPALTEVLSRYPAAKNLQVIGYYRSHLGGEVEIRQDDRWFLQEIFGDRGGLLVLLQAAPLQTTIAHIYSRVSRDDIRILHRFALANLPADEVKADEVKKADEVENRAESKQAVAPDQARNAAEGASTPLTGNSWLRRPALLLVSLAFLILIGVFELTRRPAIEDFTKGGPVGLSMQTQGDKVEFSWNVRSAAAENAVRGTLVIVSQANVARVDLNTAQVQAGRYEYKAASGVLTCQIMFFQGDNAFAGQTKDFDVKIAGRAVTPPPEPHIEQTVASTGSGVKREPAEPPNVTPLQITKIPALKIPTPRKRQPAFVLPPPSLTSRTASPQVAVPPALNAVPPAPIAAPPVGAALFGGSTSPLVPPPPRSQPLVYSGPVAVSRVTPSISPVVRSMLHGDTVIKVVIEVDRTGKVTEATSAAENTGIEKLLGPQAVQAAKLWKFEPARRNGVAVAGETVVLFKFEK